MNNEKRPTSGNNNAQVIRPMGRGGGPMGGRMNAQKPKDLGKTVKRLMSYIGSSKILVFALIGIVIVITGLELAGPWLQGEAINTIKFKGIFNSSGELESVFDYVDIDRMITLLVIMAIFYVTSSLMSYVEGILAAKLSQRTVYTLRNDLFKKISRLSIRYTDTHRHGDIMSRMTNDVENVSNAISQSISSLFSSVISLIGAAVLMIMISWQLTLIALVTVPLTVFVSSSLAKIMRKYYIKQQKLLGELNGHIEEMVTGYKTVVSYGKEDEQVDHFSKISREFKKASIRARIWDGIMGPCMNFIGNLQYLLLAAFGGYFAINGAGLGLVLEVGDIQKILGYSKRFTRPINMIANQYSQILTALAGAERIFEIMDSPDEIDEGTEEIDIDNIKGYIDFKNIHFGYEKDEPVLKGLNLSIKPGQKIAIVGSTGSGRPR